MCPAKPARDPIELKVEYRKLNSFFADYVKNISRGGTFIQTERPLPVGTVFLFRLVVPRRAAPFVLRGAVAWTNQAGAIQSPEVTESGMGIHFEFAVPADRQRFEVEVDRLMTDALGPWLFEQLIGRKPQLEPDRALTSADRRRPA